MNLRFKTNLLEHTKAVGQWAQARGARAAVNTADVSLIVECRGRVQTLWPQFVGRRQGDRLSYFNVADHHAVGFVGWLPQRPQAWSISLHKPAFKALAQSLGLATPASAAAGGRVAGPWLAKRERGAFGDGLRGPFAALPEGAPPPVLQPGEFIEAFVQGDITRAWYWCGELVVLESFAMPRVHGDGAQTLEQLLLRATAGEPPAATQWALCALQGLQPGSVPARGQAVLCDYRYVSPCNPTLYANHNRLASPAMAPLAQRLRSAGRALWPAVAAECTQAGAPAQAMFVLDAIVDADGTPWLLEINSNAQGHPDAYAALLDGLFGIAP